MTELRKGPCGRRALPKSERGAQACALAKTNAHLLQTQAALAGGDVQTTPTHPLLDASMLKPMADLIAKAQARCSRSAHDPTRIPS